VTSTLHRSSLRVVARPAPNNLWLAYDSFVLLLQAAHRTKRTIEYYHEEPGDSPARLAQAGRA
jgi:hypothetical protein